MQRPGHVPAQGACHRRQRQHRRYVRPSRRRALPVLALRRGAPGDPVSDRRLGRRARPALHADRGRLRHRRPLLQGHAATPARTPDRCGAPAGSSLATGTFTNETATGWQTLAVRPTVCAVSAGTTYVAQLPRAQRPLRRRLPASSPRRTTWRHRCRRSARTSGETNGVYCRRWPFPTSILRRHELLRGRPLHRRRHHRARRDGPVPAAGCDRASPPRSSPRRPSRARSTPAPLCSPSRMPRASRRRRRDLRRGDQDGDVLPAQNLAYSASYTVSVNASSMLGVADGRARHVVVHHVGDRPAARRLPMQHLHRSAHPHDHHRPGHGRRRARRAKFTADVDGEVVGVKFYKGPSNLGTHTGSLWSATGTAPRHRDVRRRVEHRLADGLVLLARERRGEHHLHRLLPGTRRRVLLDRQRARRRGQLPAPPHGVARWPATPTARMHRITSSERQLLGGCALQPDRCRPERGHCQPRDAGATNVSATSTVERDVRRAGPHRLCRAWCSRPQGAPRSAARRVQRHDQDDRLHTGRAP